MSNRIVTQRHLINWPQHQNIPDSAIIRIVGAEFKNTENTTIQVPITINRENLNQDEIVTNNHLTLRVNYQGHTYTQQIHVDLVDPDKADYHQPIQEGSNMRHHSPFDNNANQAQPNRKQHRKTKFVILLILLIALIGGITACHHQNQVQQAQNDRIAQLDKQNDHLQQQVDQLKTAVKQYKQDNDLNRLRNQLDQIKAENQQLKNQQNQNDINKLDQAIDQIKTDPTNARQYLNQIPNVNHNNVANWWNNLTNQVQNWLNSNEANN